MKGVSFMLILLFSVSFRFLVISANIVLTGNNKSLSFDSVEANFAPSIKSSGIYGVLYAAEPPDACSDLTNKVEFVSNIMSPFVLIVRGQCGFEEKVRRAQKAGFEAAIVYDNVEDGGLVAMAGNGEGIQISAVFVSKTSGLMLKKYAGMTNIELCIIPSFENSAWSMMAISLISLLAMSAVLATCFFVRRHRTRSQRHRTSRVREFHGMSKRLVKAMPSLIFTSVLDDNCTSSTCAICLEDYSYGEKIRVLPCQHKFHAVCVDSWLTTWRTFCPVCKRDARTSTGEPPASESTPLLSSSAGSLPSSSVLSSFRSATSSAIQIAPSSSRSPSAVTHIPSLPSSSFAQQSLRSFHPSPSLSYSRSSADLRITSSQRSAASHLISPHSLGYPSMAPLNSRYTSPYIPSPRNASPTLVSSTSNVPRPLQLSESAASFSPYNSAHSLPEC